MKTYLSFFIFFLFTHGANSQWIEQVSNVTVSLNCVSSLYIPISPIHGWVCGNNGTVLKTTNEGTNWINVSAGIPASVNLTTILGYNNSFSRAITCGVNSTNQAVVYYTSNGGLNWQNTFTQLNGNIYGFVELGGQDNTLLIGKPVGGRWSLWRSTNQGISWDSAGLFLAQSGSETGFNNSVYGIEGKVWFGTNNSRIYYSNSNGTSWSQQSTAPEVNTSTIWFQYLLTDLSTIGYGLAGSSSLVKSTNLGTSWLPVSTTGAGNITGIAGSPSQFVKSWYSKEDKIYTGSTGTNWGLEYTAPNGLYTNLSNNKLGSPNVWGVRNNGGISRNTGTIGINTISSEIPNHFSLSQNYPNPFNPATNFEFQIPKTGFVNLTIYDATGREVAILVNGEMKPGAYKADWDASNFVSGVYFYKLSAGDFSETRKMVLIK